ncbi:MAG: DUF4340 domain-containing protein [Lachnospiraceae bacterium]|nr:DUF4340 domain-containing protein [Lachnospiraceae bacterium]
MKKQKKQFIALLIILLLAVGAYIYFTYFRAPKIEEGSVSVTEVFHNDVGSVKELMYMHDGVTVELTRDGDTWYLANDKSIKLDQDKVTDILRFAANLNASTTLEDVTDLSEYGLDAPDYTVSFTTSDGVQTTFYIGDFFGVDGTYFARVEGDNNVYKIVSYYADSLVMDVDQLKADTTQEQ